ncbi:sensor histidine kinase [Paenibacillus sp. 32O-W]|uniref:cache domain-containing sensor histidine kinase n=1 Tax=Paenibacillus sp. 32O-W TaxID=1695218 RepID=UPI001642FA76|nr:histidine kinase [Paenibacillus sp. 32O-W]
MSRIKALMPSSLKNRLFLSFVLFIVLPFFLVQIRSYDQMESLYEERIGEQSQYQLDQMVSYFEQIKTRILMTSLQLEKELQILLAQSEEGRVEKEQIQQLLKEVKANLFADGAFVNYTLTGLDGVSYTSIDNGMGVEDEAWAAGAIGWLRQQDRPSMQWLLLSKDSRPNGQANTDLLTLFSVVQDRDRLPLGVLRISFDYRKWLQDQTGRFLIQQDYFLLNEQGGVLFQTRPDASMPTGLQKWVRQKWVRQQHATGEREPLVDRQTSSILTSSGIESLNWTLVAQFPLQVFFGDIGAVQRQAYVTFGLFTLVFVVMTFFISSTVTRPLRLLRNKMSDLTRSQFRVHLPTDKYRGEMMEMAESFNQMVRDLNRSVERLKIEERRREAVHFQILMQQMNPHFLLNTLNTIKWNAYARGDGTTGEICIALGRLLETSLNTEEELIYLQREMELIEAYIKIQRFRYEQSFVIRYEYEEGLRYALVPKFSLQPLVENAIRHGFARMKEGGVIVIRAWREEGSLLVHVDDNGAGLQASAAEKEMSRRPSIGLNNIRERLHLLFKGEAGLELASLEKGTRAALRVPFLNSTPYEADKGGIERVEGFTG